MAQKLAKCPYCKGLHRTKKAFNKCKNRNAKARWTRDGMKIVGGK